MFSFVDLDLFSQYVRVFCLCTIICTILMLYKFSYIFAMYVCIYVQCTRVLCGFMLCIYVCFVMYVCNVICTRILCICACNVCIYERKCTCVHVYVMSVRAVYVCVCVLWMYDMCTSIKIWKYIKCPWHWIKDIAIPPHKNIIKYLCHSNNKEIN